MLNFKNILTEDTEKSCLEIHIRAYIHTDGQTSIPATISRKD